MRRSIPRRAVQALAVALLAASGSMLALAGGAHAAGPVSTNPAVLQQGWWWQNAYQQANPPVAQQPPATEPSGVPDGDLAVAYSGSADKSSSKMSALSFDVAGLQPGTSIESFTFALTLDTQPAATSFNTVGATVVACQPTRLWSAQAAGDYTNEPTVDCAQKVAPTVAGNVYTFKIPMIAQSWVDDQNLGVAIVADPQKSAAPFQLVFKSAKALRGSLTYLPATSASGGGSTPTGAGGAAVAAPAPAVASGAGAAAAPPPATSGNVPLTGAATDTTGSAAPPVVAGSAPATSTRPVAAVKRAPVAPTAAFWLAGVALALILLFTSLVLGDPTPAPAAATRSRLDEVLRTRDAGALTARTP